MSNGFSSPGLEDASNLSVVPPGELHDHGPGLIGYAPRRELRFRLHIGWRPCQVVLYHEPATTARRVRSFLFQRRRRGGKMGAPSVARALDVLEYLAERAAPTPAAVIQRRCGIPKTTLHHILHELRGRGYVVYHPQERGWSIGSRLRQIGSDALLFNQALAILEAFPSGSDGLTPSAIALEAGLGPKATERALRELEQRQFVTLRPDGAYSLGLELVSLSSRIRWLDTCRLAAHPSLVHLRDVTGETANLVVQDGDYGLYIDQVESRSALRYSGWVGRRVPIEGTATGAALEDGAPHVVADAVEAGVTAVACGVHDACPALAVSILAPTGRLELAGVERAVTRVEAAARQIGERLARARGG